MDISPLGGGHLCWVGVPPTLTTLVRDLVGGQLPHLLHREGLGPVACIASSDELGNIPGQPWPPVVPQHQFHRVSCNGGSMVHMHQVMMELRLMVFQNINPTSIQTH